MKVQEIQDWKRLVPQKHAAGDVPHVVIETNGSCNIRCRTCYATDRTGLKTLEQIKAEIDTATSLRRLEAVSLLGGEPTLHPQLADVVRYVKSRGLVCSVFTNGVRLLRHEGPALLDSLVAAGVDRVMLHVDAGQERPDGPVEDARERLFGMLDSREVLHGLSVTLYPGDEGALPRLARTYARHRWFDGALVTLAYDFEHAFDPGGPKAETSLSAVYRSLSGDLGVEPSAYVPSSLDDDEVSWLVYFYFVNAATGLACGVSPRVNRLLREAYRRREGREFFAATLSPRWTPAAALAAAAAESALSPRSAARWARMMAGGVGPGDVRMQYLLLQRAPRWRPDRQAMEICWHCPDATLRGGRLVPVCLASRFAPLDGSAPTVPEAAVRSVHAHLEG